MTFLGFVLLSTLVFTGIILLLVAILSFIEVTVVKPGECRLFVNEEANPIGVHTGDNLLKALSHSLIFLPAACGGEGKCGLCKCRVLEGGGDALMTETGHLSREERKNHFRLACQVKIRGDLKIHVEESVLNIKKFKCKVRSNRNVASFIKELVLELPENEPMHFKPGGYIQIDIPTYKINFKDFIIDERFRGEWDKYKMWDFIAENREPVFRAYSMANYPVESNLVMLNVRIATPPPDKPSAPPGIASSYVFNLKAGDEVVVSGPFGEFFIKDTNREMVYIAGGAGMAPMRSHLFHLFKTLKTNRKVTYWYGARSLREMFYEEEFRKIEKEYPNFKFNIALSAPLPEDNWKGYVGFIHQVVYEHYIKNHEEPDAVEYYLCGPPVMVDAVEKMLYQNGVPKEMIAFDKFG